MIIAVTCPSCAHRYDVPCKRSGRRVRCAKCATTFRVPIPTHIEAEPARAESPKKPKRSRLAALFESSELKPPEVPLSPRLGGQDRGPKTVRIAFAAVAVGLLAAVSGRVIRMGLPPWAAVILLSLLGGAAVARALAGPRRAG